MTVASVVQTVPGLALVAMFYPLLLALSALTARLLGFTIASLGFLPALLALTLYSMLPILRNTVVGLTGLDPAVLEAADGVGMTARQRLVRVEAPLAAPTIMAGVRTAAVWTIGAATLSTPVGQASLGNFIFSGLQTENWVSVVFGCIAAAALALVVDLLLALIERGAARSDPRLMILGVVALLVGTAAAAAPLLVAKPIAYVVGAKNFGEQFILAELISRRLEEQGAQVAHRDGLGSAVIFRALQSGDVDVYVDYSGTLWSNVLGHADAPPRALLLKRMTAELERRFGVGVSPSLGFENAYALAMKRSQAKALGIVTVADLARQAPQLKLGADLEFLGRPEWRALQAAYGLRFRASAAYNPTFMYDALASGQADVISAFSSDGRIAAQDLVVLADPKGALPSYDAVVLTSPRRRNDPVMHRALAGLPGSISVERMRAANLLVDRSTDKKSPAQAASVLAADNALK